MLGDTTGGVSDPALAEAQQGVAPPPNGLLRMLSASTIDQHPNRAFLYSQISGLNPPRADNVLGSEGPTRTDLARQPVPTLLIVGEEDLIAPVEIMRALHRLIPDSRLAVVAGAAHSTYFEQPDEFNRLVADFLAQVLTCIATTAAD